MFSEASNKNESIFLIKNTKIGQVNVKMTLTLVTKHLVQLNYKFNGL